MSRRETVLVTGAAGFIGSHVAEHCLKLGFDVVATDDLSGGFRDNVPPGVEWIAGDLRDPAFVASVFAGRGFAYVYHLAAYAAEGLSHFVRRFNYRTNLLASVNVINECVRHDVRTLVFTSSIAVYGRHQTPMTEDMVPAPEDPYGIAKYAVELDLRAAHETFGLDYVVFRPHNVYGERQNIADRYRNVVGIFMSQVMQGQPMTIFGDGHQTRAFSYIDDVAPLIAAAPLVPAARNQTFNVGADTPCSVLELAAEVASAFGVPRRIVHLPPRSEVTHAFCDHARLRAAFDPPPPPTLRDGIQRMASWARTRRLVPTTVGAEIEVDKNLPASWRT